MRLAFVILKVEAPMEVAKGFLSKLPSVAEVNAVACEGNAGYNFVVEVAAETMEELKENVERVRKASFVMSSCTLIAAGERGR